MTVAHGGELLVKNEKLKGQGTKLDPGLDTQQKYGLPWTSAGRTRRQIKPVRASPEVLISIYNSA